MTAGIPRKSSARDLRLREKPAVAAGQTAARVLYAARDKPLDAIIGRVDDDVVGVSARCEKIEADLAVAPIMKIGAKPEVRHG